MAKIAIGRTRRLNGRIVKWNGKRWVPTTTPKKVSTTTPKKVPARKQYKAPSIPKKKEAPKPKAKAKPTAAQVRADAAGRRALRRTATRTGVKGGLIGLGMAGVEYAGRKGKLGKKIKEGYETKDAQIESLLKHGPTSDKAYQKPPAKSENKTKAKKKTGNTVTGQADYTKQQQRLSDARSKYNKKPEPKTKPTQKTVPAGKVPSTPKVTAPSSKGSRMASSSSADRMATWAKANRKMIEKNGTKKQKELLAKALKVNTSKTKSSANAAGWQGNRNY